MRNSFSVVIVIGFSWAAAQGCALDPESEPGGVAGNAGSSAGASGSGGNDGGRAGSSAGSGQGGAGMNGGGRAGSGGQGGDDDGGESPAGGDGPSAGGDAGGDQNPEGGADSGGGAGTGEAGLSGHAGSSAGGGTGGTGDSGGTGGTSDGTGGTTAGTGGTTAGTGGTTAGTGGTTAGTGGTTAGTGGTGGTTAGTGGTTAGAGGTTAGTGGTTAGTGGTTAGTGGTTGGAGSGGSSGSGAGSGGTGGVACGGVLPAIKTTPLAWPFAQPVFVGQAPGDANALFVVEQTGRIKITRGGQAPTVFLDINTLVLSGGERGLLGLAFSPSYAQNGLFYVNYTAVSPSGETVIAEYQRSTADVANPTAVRVIHRVSQPFSNHNGGNLLFGPGGLLYVGLGDGGDGFDPNNNAQNDSAHLGKMLRIDVGPTTPAISIWAKGLRNPWRYSIDPVTELLYIGDVGQNSREEIDVVSAVGNGGYNFGWRKYEGTAVSVAGDPEIPGAIQPVAETRHNGDCAIVGGYVYRGSAIPCLAGWYLYGDYCTGLIRAFRYESGAAAGDTQLSITAPALSSFGVDNAGELYTVRLSGTISRIEPQ